MNEACCPTCGKSMVEVRYCPECRNNLVVMGVNHDPHGEHRLFARLARHAAEKAGLAFLRLISVDYYNFEVHAMVAEAVFPGETARLIGMAEDNDFLGIPPWLKIRFDADPDGKD